jgi:hypothetical protein
MKCVWKFYFAAALALISCKRETPNEAPLTEVNKPRPKAIVEPPTP